MTSTSPRMTRKNSAASTAPPAPIQMRPATSATPAASATRNGWKTCAYCGTPKSNSAWNVDTPMRNPPTMPMRRSATIFDGISVRPRSSASPIPWLRSASEARTAWPTSVMPAPPMSIRCVGPQSVTSWPNSRCHRSSSGKPMSAKAPQAAMRMPPTGAYQSRWIFTAAGPGRSPLCGSATARMPEAKTPYRPARMR